MCKDITYCLLLSWLVFFSPVVSSSQNYDDLIDTSFKKRKAGFANLEHRSIGDSVQLNWGQLAHQLPNNHIELSNGMELSYGELIMFAGDLFGSDAYPISKCSEQQRPFCFYKQFEGIDQIKSNPYQNPPSIIPVYREYFTTLEDNILQAKEKGLSEWQYYLQNGSDISKSLNQISGGGSFISDYLPFGEYIKLASVNFDHFVPGALVAYKTGHEVAIEIALQAHDANQAGQSEQAHKLLSQAYAMNAYANHYLTDAMSAGHFRTPRQEIADNVYLPKVLGLLIANLMHDEDNRSGLNVTNNRGLSWHAYGDGFLNHPEAYQQYNLILQLVQESADAIYAAYDSGQRPTEYNEMNLLPNYDSIDQLNNHPPLFKWEDGYLYKRQSNFDINDNNYTIWWSGIVTLIDFNQHDWSDVLIPSK